MHTHAHRGTSKDPKVELAGIRSEPNRALVWAARQIGITIRSTSR